MPFYTLPRKMVQVWNKPISCRNKTYIFLVKTLLLIAIVFAYDILRYMMELIPIQQ